MEQIIIDNKAWVKGAEYCKENNIKTPSRFYKTLDESEKLIIKAKDYGLKGNVITLIDADIENRECNKKENTKENKEDLTMQNSEGISDNEGLEEIALSNCITNNLNKNIECKEIESTYIEQIECKDYNNAESTMQNAECKFTVIDQGASSYKITHDGKVLPVYKSLFRKVEKVSFQKNALYFNSQWYLCDDINGIYSKEVLKHKKDYLPLLLYGLAQIDEEEFNLRILVPEDQLIYEWEYKRKLEGKKFKVQLNYHEPKIIKINYVECAAEGISSLGVIPNSIRENLQEDLLIMNFGMSTFDIALYNKNLSCEYAKSLAFGMRKLYFKLLSPQYSDSVAVQKHIHEMNINDEANWYLDKIEYELAYIFEMITKKTKVLCVGGGAIALKDYLKKRFPNQIVVSDNQKLYADCLGASEKINIIEKKSLFRRIKDWFKCLFK